MIPKNTVCIIIALIVCAHSRAQNFNYATHGGIESTGGMVQINSRSFYLVKQIPVPGCCSENIKLSGRSATNGLLFNKNITNDPYVNYFGLVATSDQKIIAYGGTRLKGCDYGGPRFRLEKTDTNGVSEFSITVLKQITDVLACENGCFDFFANDSMFRYSSNNQLIAKRHIGIKPYASLSLQKNLSLVSYSLYTNNTVHYRLKMIDSLGNQVNEVSTPGAILDLRRLTGGSVIGVSGGQLAKYSLNLIAQANSSVSLPSGNSITAVYVSNDTVYAAGLSALSEPKYFLFDTVLNLLYQSNTNLEGVIPTGISVTPDKKVRLVTTGHGSQHSYSGYFELDRFDSVASAKDVGVMQLPVVTHTLTTYPYWGATMCQPLIAAQALVKNFGADTIKYFKLNSYSHIGGISTCYIGLHQDFTVTIPPGDSVVVQTNTFNTPPFNAANIPSGETFTMNVCISSSVPDRLNDYVVQNNTFCELISMKMVGLNENKRELFFEIYPNPAQNYIFFKSSVAIQAARLMSATGKEISEYSEDLTELEISGLADGIYFMEFLTEYGWVVKKFVVAR